MKQETQPQKETPANDKREKIQKLAKAIKDYLSEGKYSEALNTVNEILALAPDYEEALLTKIQLLLYFKKFRDADKTADFAIEKHPGNPYTYLSKAIITVLYKSNIEEAVRHLDKGIKICPDCFELIVAKAQMLYWLGDSSYNLWIERASNLDKERTGTFLKKYWVERLPVPASYPGAQLHGIISNILFLISQQKYDGLREK